MENKFLEKDKNLEIILQKSKLKLPDCKVYLFGSRARGDNELDSDYDILLIVKQTFSVKEKVFIRSSLRSLLAKDKIYADIIIQDETEIERKKNIPGNIIYYAFPEAVPI
jgi:predicted nucleotidyltransferase